MGCGILKTKILTIVLCLSFAYLFSFVSESYMNTNIEAEDADFLEAVEADIKQEPYFGNLENKNGIKITFKQSVVEETAEIIVNNTDDTLSMVKQDKEVDDILFIGNSLVEGFRLTANTKDKFICEVGISLKGLKKYFSQIEKYPCDFVAIEMGTNELGSYSEEEFKSEYLNLINKIFEVNENAKIYCISIPPVSQRKSDNSEYFNNNNVEKYNKYILDICEENNLVYIDSTPFFGYILDSSITGDGIHLIGKKYIEWFNFVRDFIIEDNK